MNRYSKSPASSPSSTSNFSSPALPELSLDASLHRLHQQEDISASSLSSAALSRTWLRNTQEQVLDSLSSSPNRQRHFSRPSEESNSIRNLSFRFPPLQSAHEISTTSPIRISPTTAQPVESELPARPRTSRGLSEPKPFFSSSSSRTTSISSMVEVGAMNLQHSPSQIVFGTPFAGSAGKAFDSNMNVFERHFSATEGQPRRPTTSAREGKSRRFGAGFSPKQLYLPPSESTGRIETGLSHTKAPSENSSWTLLFAPLEQSGDTDTDNFEHAEENVLLPLLGSLQDQIESLRTHLIENLKSGQSHIHTSRIKCYLDLSSISILPSKTLAQLTNESWNLTFDRFSRQSSSKTGERPPDPLPYIYRETGLPIAASIRYSLTSHSAHYPQSVRTLDEPRNTLSQQDGPAAFETQHQSHDSNPWRRRESEMTVCLSGRGRLGVSSGMVASHSYPGNAKTPVRRTPLPYSPNKAVFPRDNALVKAALIHRDSPITYSFSAQENASRGLESSKLRNLSLAAVHPLSSTEDKIASAFQSSVRQNYLKGVPHSANEPHSGFGSQDDNVDNGDEGEGSSPARQRYQSSRGSSHKSFHSHTTSLSTHSTRNTSIYSSRSRSHQHAESDLDAQEHDDDLGSRFWTQLSDLGEQVSRETQSPSNAAGHARGSQSRNVSTSSTASDASSVFSFSPLGILVPTEGASETIAKGAAIGRGADQGSVQSSKAMGIRQSSALSLQSSGVLGRRRAYSSMVPLTGWRAGDSDLLTAEGQQAGVVKGLPQVLLLEPKGDVQGSDSNDLVTPTVATFQGRTRALSFQPAGTAPIRSVSDSHTLNAPGIGIARRQDVWEEAMHQLSEHLKHSRPQVSPTHLQPTRNTTSNTSSSSLNSVSTVKPVPPPRLSTEGASVQVSDILSPTIESSPLPGLFYENWVERVDGAVDGDLGRRGSSFQLPAQPQSSLLHTSHTLGPCDTDGALSRTSSTSSGSTMLGSAGSEPSLQILHESEWPMPQSRSSDVERDGGGSLPRHSGSFFSVLSPDAGESGSGIGEDAVVTHCEPHAQAALAPVKLFRPFTVSVSRITQSPSIRPSALPLTFDPIIQAPLDSMAGWADLAQRLRSPGSMRLLCLAASNWSTDQIDVSNDDVDLTAVSTSIGAVPSGLIVPSFASSNSVPNRGRSLDGITRGIDVKEEADTTEREVDVIASSTEGTRGTVEKEKPKRLIRKKEAILKMIHNSSSSSDPDDEQVERLSVERHLAPIAVTRMKRSLSNIFDLASPVTPNWRPV
ncbi:uncharacterized protein MEPE_05398 [Melanopsichium pennsylvanicum]|uniref:Uncharacterized protein n=2 Tax=Melanopsichium pennsylvanicum TaxID=63383 RepID=A0AAJ4XQM4_9BASI|nr:hypothetical protein BN887_04770 [Melanopsichium pennsylvanicum 4]SNX86689.1 uncharacterized protein MEPE_05398 [Melanopsichium pennsylvanicum]